MSYRKKHLISIVRRTNKPAQFILTLFCFAVLLTYDFPMIRMSLILRAINEGTLFSYRGICLDGKFSHFCLLFRTLPILTLPSFTAVRLLRVKPILSPRSLSTSDLSFLFLTLSGFEQAFRYLWEDRLSHQLTLRLFPTGCGDESPKRKGSSREEELVL